MKNKTMLNNNTQIELLKVTTRSLKKFFIIFGVMIVFLGLFINQYDDEIGIGLIIGGVIVILTFIFLGEMILVSRYKKNTKLKEEILNDYEFTEVNLLVNSFRDDEEFVKSILKYSDIIKVIENKHYLFLFISNIQAFVLSKNEMTEGCIEDLINLLKSKINKYIVVK